MKVDLIVIRASQLLTLRGPAPRRGREQMNDLGIVEDGAVAVLGERIVDVGRTGEILGKYRASTVIDAGGRVVMPGFVDPHTHLVFAGSREDELELKLRGVSYLEILRRGGGIYRTVRETRGAPMWRLVELALDKLNEMMIHGTTTVEAKSGYGLFPEDELKILSAIKMLGNMHPLDVVPTVLAHVVPEEYKGGAEDRYVELFISKVAREAARRGMAEFIDVFCEEGVFTASQSMRILSAGKRFGLAPKIHADEFTNCGGAEVAARVGAVSADHLQSASEEGLRMMAEAGVAAVLLPGTSLTTMKGVYPDARRMIEMGLPVALATDFNPNCWVTSMQEIMSLAIYNMGMTQAEVIVAATLNAAYALRRHREVGSLEQGKLADIVVMDVPNYRFIGYKFGANMVNTVIKRGRVVFQRGLG